MRTGWELIVQRNGRWYSVERNLTPTARADLLNWMRVNGYTSGNRYAMRQVNEDSEFLSASPSPDGTEQDEDMPTSRDEAKRDGGMMGAALAALIQSQTSDQGAVFTVARRFAVFAGYRDVEDALSYIEGFTEGYAHRAPIARIGSEQPG